MRKKITILMDAISEKIISRYCPFKLIFFNKASTGSVVSVTSFLNTHDVNFDCCILVHSCMAFRVPTLFYDLPVRSNLVELQEPQLFALAEPELLCILVPYLDVIYKSQKIERLSGK